MGYDIKETIKQAFKEHPLIAIIEGIIAFFLLLFALTITLSVVLSIFKPTIILAHDTTSFVLETIFILVAIVLGGQLYVYGLVRKEFDEIERRKKVLDEKLDKVVKEYEFEKEKTYAEFQIRDAVRNGTINNSLWDYLRNKIVNMLTKEPLNFALVLSLSKLYRLKNDYTTCIEIYGNFIKMMKEKNNYSNDLATAYFNSACQYALIYCSDREPDKSGLKKNIEENLREAVKHDPTIKTDDSLEDSDFKCSQDKDWKDWFDALKNNLKRN